VAVAPGGAVHVAGIFRSSCNFGDGPGTSKGEGDVFLLKLLQ
jgi:hypothetical protein